MLDGFDHRNEGVEIGQHQFGAAVEIATDDDHREAPLDGVERHRTKRIDRRVTERGGTA